MKICSFIYDINKLGFVLWLESGILKYRLYQDCLNRNEIIQQIQTKKNEIIEFLKENGCNLPEKPNQYKIYKTRDNTEALSLQQEGLWLIDKLDKNANSLNIPLIFELRDGFDLKVLEASIKNIICRHSSLRTLIKLDHSLNPYQIVSGFDPQHFIIESIKVSDERGLEQALKTRMYYAHDLSREYPIKVCFYERTDRRSAKNLLSIIIHHIAFDGWSINILIDELHQLYVCHSKCLSEAPQLSIGIEYKDFVCWQRSSFSAQKIAEKMDFWKSKLAEFAPLNLMTDYPRPSQVNYSGENVRFDLEQDLVLSLNTLAIKANISLSSIMLAAYYLMLKVFSNQEDVVIGLTLPNRHHGQTENIIGFFANFVPLRMKFKPNMLLAEFLKQLHDEVLELQEYQDLPFNKLVQELGIKTNGVSNPIFQITFEGLNFTPMKATKDGGALELCSKYSDDLYKISRFDLSFFIDYDPKCINGKFVYATSLYSVDTINRLKEIYLRILRQISQGAQHSTISDISYLTKEEYIQAVHTWNATNFEYQGSKTIHKLFEELVHRTPDGVAIVYNDHCLTYGVVNEMGNKLAHFLRSVGVGPEILVGFMLDKSSEMIITILAILKVGGAYVPLDPDHPQNRIQHVLDETNLSVILTNNKLIDRLPFTFSYIVDLEEQWDHINTFPSLNLNELASSHNLAYILYTSGSTGKPNGVMIEHQSLVNYSKSIIDIANITIEDRVDFSTSIGFDLTVTTTLSALVSGAKVVVYDGSLNDVEQYRVHLKKHCINLIKLVPSYLQATRLLFDVHVSKVILGGEKVSANLLRDLHDMQTDLVIDEYGPTEATVGVYCQEIYKAGSEFADSHVRYHNVKLYILDSALNYVPIGAVGELYIGGDCLARGYFNFPELTAERFIANPFYHCSRLYKTGDLARYSVNGEIEYIGRNNSQVKIRGYRIELGEIEGILSDYRGIKQCVVIANGKDGEHQNLITYYVADVVIEEEDLKKYLSTRLPHYMIPSFFVYLRSLPLTLNGKIDKNALIELNFIATRSYVAPQNAIEKQLCEIWAESLQMDHAELGVHDDFFQLGGNSILAIKLLGKINSIFSIECNVSSVFECKNISNLSKVISTMSKTSMNGTRYAFKGGVWVQKC